MIGALFILFGTLLSEISALIGKFKATQKKESLFLMGFLETFWVMLFFIIIALCRGTLYLDPASLPIFFIRVIFELVVFTLGLQAIIKADRSTNAFLTIITIPLLLIVDIALGYDIAALQIIGIVIIIIALCTLYIKHGIRKKGSAYIILWACGAVITISLFKYNITHYNSVEAEGAYMYLILCAYSLIMTLIYDRRNPFPYLFKYPYNLESLTRGVAVPLLSFAYMFGTASIILTAKRVLSIIWSIFFGNHYFHEKRIGIKIICLVVVFLGLVLIY